MKRIGAISKLGTDDDFGTHAGLDQPIGADALVVDRQPNAVMIVQVDFGADETKLAIDDDRITVVLVVDQNLSRRADRNSGPRNVTRRHRLRPAVGPS